MKKLLIILLIFSSTHLFSQTNTNKFNYQFGGGISDFSYYGIYISIENEINYKINNYFSSSVSFEYGKEIPNKEETAVSHLQGNINLFVSPLKNNKKNNLKIGTGFSYNDISVTIRKYAIDPYGSYDRHLIILDDDCVVYSIDENKFIDLSLIIEDNYLIKDKYLIGIKAYTQVLNYSFSGILLKFGVVL